MIKLSQKTKTGIGTSLLFVGIASFFFLMQFLGIFGSSVEYRNPVIIFKQFIPFLSMLGFTYLGLSLLSGQETAKQTVKSIGLPLIIAFFIGWLFNS